MLDFGRKTSKNQKEDSTNSIIRKKLMFPPKWKEETEYLKSHKDSETDFSSTYSASRMEERSISPLDKQKSGFSALTQALGSKTHYFSLQTQNPNPKYKTELCKNFDIYGYCKWGANCFFAHGKTELKSKTLISDFYKTKICKHYHKIGFCPYASRCQYFHFKTYQIYQELLDSFESKLTYRINEGNQKLNKMLSTSDRIQNRLEIFKGLAPGDNNKSLQEKFLDNEF